MQKLTLEQAADRLAGLERVLILFHARPDGDAVGSAFALRRALCLRGCEAWCVCPHELPARLRFLVELDGEEAQESVLPAAIPERLADAPVVSVDTAAPGQAGELADEFLPRCVLMIDHHASGTPYADHCILPTAAAAGEVLLPILLRLREGDGALDSIVAARLFAAIASDTGCFKFSNAGAATHRAAADLLDADFGGILEPAEITRRLFDCKTPGTLRGEQAALRNLRLFADGRIAVTTLSHAEREAEGLRPEDTETMIEAIRVLAGCEIAATIKQADDTTLWRVSLRSTGPNVAAVAAVFGGGGHHRAAGCALEAASADEAVEMLVERLEGAL